MMLMVMVVLGYSSLNVVFPTWMWVFAIVAQVLIGFAASSSVYQKGQSGS